MSTFNKDNVIDLLLQHRAMYYAEICKAEKEKKGIMQHCWRKAYARISALINEVKELE